MTKEVTARRAMNNGSPLTTNNLIVWSLLASFFIGCVGKPYNKNFSPTQAPKIDQTRVISHIDQDSLYAQFESQYTQVNGGFLLGNIVTLATTFVTTLIDYNISKSNRDEAQAAIKPVLSSLRATNIDAVLHGAFNRSANQIPRLSIAAYEIFKNDDAMLDYRVRNQIIENTPEHSLLVLTSNYSLTPNFRALNITTIAQLFTKDHFEVYRGRRYYVPIYYNKFLYQSAKLTDPQISEEEAESRIAALRARYNLLTRNRSSNDKAFKLLKAKEQAVWELTRLTSLQKKEISALAWASNDARLIKKTLTRGAEEIMAMIQLDMMNTQPLDLGLFGRDDHVLYETNERVIRRKLNGEDIGILISSAKDDVINIGGVVYEPVILP